MTDALFEVEAAPEPPVMKPPMSAWMCGDPSGANGVDSEGRGRAFRQ